MSSAASINEESSLSFPSEVTLRSFTSEESADPLSGSGAKGDEGWAVDAEAEFASAFEAPADVAGSSATSAVSSTSLCVC